MEILRAEIFGIAQRELRYKHDPEIEAQLIFLYNPHYREMTYSINIGGGRMIIGIDHQHFLNNVEVLKPNRIPVSPKIPDLPSQLDNIGIHLETFQKHTDLELPITVAMTESPTCAIITVGDKKNGTWTRLSVDSWVRISDNELSGFFVKLT